MPPIGGIHAAWCACMALFAGASSRWISSTLCRYSSNRCASPGLRRDGFARAAISMRRQAIIEVIRRARCLQRSSWRCPDTSRADVSKWCLSSSRLCSSARSVAVFTAISLRRKTGHPCPVRRRPCRNVLLQGVRCRRAFHGSCSVYDLKERWSVRERTWISSSEVTEAWCSAPLSVNVQDRFDCALLYLPGMDSPGSHGRSIARPSIAAIVVIRVFGFFILVLCCSLGRPGVLRHRSPGLLRLSALIGLASLLALLRL